MGRNVTNQAEIEADLSEKGFRVVNLDKLSAVDQLSIFRNSPVIVSPHDAGLSNLLVSPAGTRVIELLPVQDVGRFDMYKNICELQGLEYKSVVSYKPQEYIIGEDFMVNSKSFSESVGGN
jgi:capsular polysaccharide biosynthesis protein